MKFSLNGALTIGTLDGANVEIREEVGAENFFLFGLTAQEVQETLKRGYRPRDFYERDEELRAVLDSDQLWLLRAGGARRVPRPGQRAPEHDPYLLLADFRAYVECQEKVSEAFRDQEKWHRAAILNIAKMGKFSSDRTIRQYASEIWKAVPIK